MSELAITVTVDGSLEDVCARVTEAIQPAGFGVLTRIDFDKKINEKLGESINPCTVLGACNPKMAFAAYQQSSDVALLIPCNIVVTEIGPGKVRVEALKLTQMLKMIPGMSTESEEVQQVEDQLADCIRNLT